MALATWKEVPGRGMRWALRVNPSSGNLHPTETHLIARGVEGLEDGLYHFRVDEFVLEVWHLGSVADLAGAYAAYGERGYRALHLEAGFIGQGLYPGADAVCLNATGIGAFFDDDVNRYLQLPEGFEVIYHFTIGRSVHDPRLADRPAYGFDGNVHRQTGRFRS